MGPPGTHRRLDFSLKLLDSRNPMTGEADVDLAFFRVKKVQDNKAVVSLIREIEGPQDIELELNMNIYSREFNDEREEIFFGTAVARFKVFVTNDPWRMVNEV